jgi:hypothetical protein
MSSWQKGKLTTGKMKNGKLTKVANEKMVS